MCIRDRIEAYLERHGIDHVEDETNGDRSLTRNRLRLDIMPLLRELYPGAEAVSYTHLYGTRK